MKKKRTKKRNHVRKQRPRNRWRTLCYALLVLLFVWLFVCLFVFVFFKKKSMRRRTRKWCGRVTANSLSLARRLTVKSRCWWSWWSTAFISVLLVATMLPFIVSPIAEYLGTAADNPSLRRCRGCRGCRGCRDSAAIQWRLSLAFSRANHISTGCAHTNTHTDTHWHTHTHNPVSILLASGRSQKLLRFWLTQKPWKLIRRKNASRTESKITIWNSTGNQEFNGGRGTSISNCLHHK